MDYAQFVWVGTQSSCTIYNLEHDTTYYFVVHAYAGDNESGDSNEIAYSTPPAPLATHTLTSTASANGSIAPLGAVAVDAGTDQTFSISPDAGCEIVDVRVDGVSVGAVSAYTFQQVAANHSISVQFAFSAHTIVASSEAGGSISPSGNIEAEHGAAQAFTISAIAGYRVADVYVDDVSVGAVSNYLFDSVVEDHTIRASFSAQTFSISASADSNGTITPSGTRSVFYGGSQTYTISPNSDYVIADVWVDGVSVGDSGTYSFANVSANHTIHAAFCSGEPAADG